MKASCCVILLLATVISVPLWIHGLRATISGSNIPGDSPAPSRPAQLPDAIQGIGFVEPVSEVRKLVLKVNGVIARCSADLGRGFKTGEVLMELDNREQLAAVTVAEAEWKMAQAERAKVLSGVNVHQIAAAAHKVDLLKEQVRHSQKEHARCHALIAKNSVTRSEYDRILTEMNQRQTELRQAEAEVQHLQEFVRDEDRKLADAKIFAAKAKLVLAEQLYRDTVLLAPFDGTVLEVLKREGEASRQSDPEPILLFGDTSRLRVRAEIDERFIAWLRVGQTAVVFGRGLGDREYRGRVAIIKSIMGKKTVFSRSATERKDLDVVQLMVDMPEDFRAPIGLEVDVRIEGVEIR